MSTRSKAKRSTQRKPGAAAAGAGGGSSILERVEQAQRRLDKNADLFRAAQEDRRREVRRAFQAGVSSKTLAATLGVSRAKVYDLLGGIKGSKPSYSASPES